MACVINWPKVLALFAYNKSKLFLEETRMSVKHKVRVVNTYIKSSFLYNSELWTPTKELENIIHAFQRLSKEVNYRRLKWLVYLLRRQNIDIYCRRFRDNMHQLCLHENTKLYSTLYWSCMSEMAPQISTDNRPFMQRLAQANERENNNVNSYCCSAFPSQRGKNAEQISITSLVNAWKKWLTYGK